MIDVDESTQHQEDQEMVRRVMQDLADDEMIAHVLFGATVFDLTSAQRVYVLRSLTGHYVRDWPGNLPGFHPVRGWREGTLFVRGTNDRSPRVMELATLGTHQLPANGRPYVQSCRRSILLAEDGQLLHEVSVSEFRDDGIRQYTKIKPCTSKRLTHLLADPLVLRTAIDKMRHHMKKRLDDARREFNRITELDALLNRVT